MSIDKARKIVESYRDLIEESKQPNSVSPMLATLTDEYFDDPSWIYERKFDGERVLAFKSSTNVWLMSRNEKDISVSYPEIADALRNIRGSFVLDGEVVAFSGDLTDFSKLQGRMHISSEKEARESGVRVYYYVFDMIYFDGQSIDQVPLRHRKAILKNAIKFQDPIRYTIHRNEYGKSYHKEACEKGWEGIIAKDGESPYVHTRSKSWLKFKCINEQEMVIAGYTDPEGERIGFGALLLGYYEGESLKYGGKVGTGFTDEDLRDIKKRLDKIKTQDNPYDSDEPVSKGVHFVRPELVGQIGFTEWTTGNKLRHPRFLGLRRDRDPKDVKKEEPK